MESGTVRTFSVFGIAAFAAIALVVLGALALITSPLPPEPLNSAAKPSAGNPDRVVSGSFVTQFGPAHDPANWYKSDFAYPGSPHPLWRADLIHFKENRIELELRREKSEMKNFSGAEYQRRGFYHFGRYEVVMQAARGSGTVSAMFTHTHAQFGDPHDEIDIEFLGNRPRQLHLNYFTGGRAAGSIYVPLGFDASEQVHLYAFEWAPDEIRWYVDEKLVHTATPDNHPIPQVPGRLMVHLWSGGPEQKNWHGRPTFRDGTRAAVYCLSYQAAGDTAGQCSDTFKAKTRKPG